LRITTISSALVGDARFVLLGDASHGTHEFCRERAEITKRLIAEKMDASPSRPGCGAGKLKLALLQTVFERFREARDLGWLSRKRSTVTRIFYR
jgi:hypothetical protein